MNKIDSYFIKIINVLLKLTFSAIPKRQKEKESHTTALLSSPMTMLVLHKLATLGQCLHINKTYWANFSTNIKPEWTDFLHIIEYILTEKEKKNIANIFTAYWAEVQNL